MIDPTTGMDIEFGMLLLLILPAFFIFVLIALSLLIRGVFEICFRAGECHD